MTHEEAIKKLEAIGFKRSEQVGMTGEQPSDRCLTFDSGCCHGWIEICGAPGLVGEVELTVDGWSEFTLRFPSLLDLVEHLR